MRIRQRARQRGVELPLILSDHSDWDELTTTITETGASEVWVTHGREEALVRWCALNGIAAQPLEPLVRYLDSYPGRVLLAADSPGRREVLHDLLILTIMMAQGASRPVAGHVFAAQLDSTRGGQVAGTELGAVQAALPHDLRLVGHVIQSDDVTHLVEHDLGQVAVIAGVGEELSIEHD